MKHFIIFFCAVAFTQCVFAAIYSSKKNFSVEEALKGTPQNGDGKIWLFGEWSYVFRKIDTKSVEMNVTVVGLGHKLELIVLYSQKSTAKVTADNYPSYTHQIYMEGFSTDNAPKSGSNTDGTAYYDWVTKDGLPYSHSTFTMAKQGEGNVTIVIATSTPGVFTIICDM